MNRIYVVPEYAEQFEQRFQTRARLVDGMPGFIWNKVLRPVNPGDPYDSLTASTWTTKATSGSRKVRLAGMPVPSPGTDEGWDTRSTRSTSREGS